MKPLGQVPVRGRGVQRVVSQADVVLFEQGGKMPNVQEGELVQLGDRKGVWRVAAVQHPVLVLERIK